MSALFGKAPDRGPPSALRGWLSDIYFPAMLDLSAGPKALEALAARLGPKATVDDPIQGRATGLPGVREIVDKTAKWLLDHSASYARTAFTTGVDRDVTEGTLSLTFDDKTIDVPVAVVAERRKSREVEVRVYLAMQSTAGKPKARGQLVPSGGGLGVPEGVSAMLDALAKGDVAAIAAQFEEDGVVRDARGMEHTKVSGALRVFFDGLVAGGAFGGGLEMERGGEADDGRTCALEYTLVKARGTRIEPQAGLMMFERGDSGLVRALRVYGELEA